MIRRWYRVWQKIWLGLMVALMRIACYNDLIVMQTSTIVEPQSLEIWWDDEALQQAKTIKQIQAIFKLAVFFRGGIS